MGKARIFSRLQQLLPHFQGLAGTQGQSYVRGSFQTYVTECDDSGHAQWGQLLGWLNRLEAESADEGRSEGAQVQVSIVFMRLTHIGDHLSIRIMQASPEGTAVTDF